MYDKIRDLSKSPTLLKDGLLYVAVHYALNRYDSVIAGINNPEMPLHNSDTERVFAKDISIFRNNSNEMLSLRRVRQEAALADSFRKNRRCAVHTVPTSPV